MEFCSRKEVKKKILLLEGMLYCYTHPRNKEFVGEYLGLDCVELTKDRISKAIAKLKEEHDRIPFGRLFQGPYYVRDYVTREAIIKNGPLLLKSGFAMWTIVDAQLNLWNYIKSPYKNPELTTILNTSDGTPIYSKEELENSLNLN